MLYTVLGTSILPIYVLHDFEEQIDLANLGSFFKVYLYIKILRYTSQTSINGPLF